MLKGRRMVLACGDRVRVARIAGDGVIEALLPRSTLFYRSDSFNEKVIAANVTQVIGVVAPDLGVDFELVDRWMVAAEAQGCRFALIANKSDKPEFAAFLDVGETERRAARPAHSPRAHGADRPVGDGQVDDPQRDRRRSRREDGGDLRSRAP